MAITSPTPWCTGNPFADCEKVNKDRMKAMNCPEIGFDDYDFNTFNEKGVPKEVIYLKFHLADNPGKCYYYMTQSKGIMEKFRPFEDHPEKFEEMKKHTTRFEYVKTSQNREITKLM